MARDQGGAWGWMCYARMDETQVLGPGSNEGRDTGYNEFIGPSSVGFGFLSGLAWPLTGRFCTCLLLFTVYCLPVYLCVLCSS